MSSFFRHVRKPAVLYPSLLTVILIGFYSISCGSQWLQYRYTTWDALRDAINTRHLLEGGQLLADPVLDGYGSWYPPTHAAILAAITHILDSDLIRAYAGSAIAFNWLAIVAFYWLAYCLCGRNPHIAFLTAISLSALPWFVTYVLVSPTVMAHATVLSIVFITFYLHYVQNESWKTIVIFSSGLGLMGLFHPPTFLILFATFGFHWYMRVRFDSFQKTTMIRAGVFLAISLAVSSPYWAVNLLYPLANPEPVRYTAPALYHLEFVLPGKSWIRSIPLLIPSAWGIGLTIRRRIELPSGFLFALFLVSILGQFPVYFLAFLRNHNPEMYEILLNRLPILVPHEFQMYGQLCLILFMGTGLHSLWLVLRHRIFRACIGIPLVLSILASLGVCLTEIPQHSKLFLWPYREKGEWNGVVKFIRQNTNVRDTICSPNDDTSFFVIGVRTGRKCLASFPSHTNTRVRIDTRRMTRDEIMYRADRDTILNHSERFRIKYLLASRKLISPERIQRFREWFPVLYDDGNTALFNITPVSET